MGPVRREVERSLADWLRYVESLHHKPIDMGLERVRQVAGHMGISRVAGRRNIIIAGTNGKGSTAVAAEALLLEQGASVGTTVSPHVHVFNERVRIGGVELDDARQIQDAIWQQGATLIGIKVSTVSGGEQTAV